MNLLVRRIQALVSRHGSLRAAARVLAIDHAYLWRLQQGVKSSGDDVLRKLGLRRVITYIDRRSTPEERG